MTVVRVPRSLTPPSPPGDGCSDIEIHTACPSGYVEWHEWAGRMGRTHVQIRCRSCRLWAIWVTKSLGTEAP